MHKLDNTDRQLLALLQEDDRLSLAELGKRIGIPECAQTASVYSRGLLQHEYGVDLKSIEWIQAGVDQKIRWASPA